MVSALTRPLRALFVEDSELDYNLILRLLGNSGYAIESRRVETEETMREALANATWDVVISDHNLPRFSATNALATLKSTGLDIPFLIVSGEIGEDIAVDAMVAGADDYVLKSRLRRLGPALARSLEAARGRQREREQAAALRASEARLRSITANLPGIVFQIRHDVAAGSLAITYASEGASRLRGTPSDDGTHGGNGSLLELLPEEDRESLQAAFEAAAAGPDELRWQGRLQSAGGALLWIALAGSPREESPGTLFWEGVITDITSQKEAEAALRELSAHMERVKEEERKAIAREIHDDIGGILTGIKFDLAWLAGNAAGDGVAKRIEGTLTLLDSARAAADRIMRDLRPAILEQGIVPALEWLTRDFTAHMSVPCTFAANRDDLALPEDRRMPMFRICQEALTNIAKHARARSVKIELFADEASATLEIADDGAGLADADRAKTDSYGLRNMQERAAGLGGWLDISSTPGAGTTIMLSLPLTDTQS